MERFEVQVTVEVRKYYGNTVEGWSMSNDRLSTSEMFSIRGCG